MSVRTRDYICMPILNNLFTLSCISSMLGWVSYDFSLYCSSITSGSYDKGRAWCVSKFLIQCFQFAYIEVCIPVQLYICTLGPTATWVHTGYLILKCVKVNNVEVMWHWWNKNTNAKPSRTCIYRKVNGIINLSTPQSFLFSHFKMKDPVVHTR